jgi:hypothetical protein
VPIASDFVKIMNACKHRITVWTRFQRPKKLGSGRARRPLESHIHLDPGETTTRPIAYGALVGAKNWDVLKERKCVQFEVIPWTSQFARIAAVRTSVLFDVKVPRAVPKHIHLVPGETSRTVPLANVIQRRKIQNLAKKGLVRLERSDIGPRLAAAPAVGSLGYDDVYICDECGGPIVFRYSPPIPIHI